MKFTIKDRVTLLGLTEMESLVKKLQFTDEEREKYSIVKGNDGNVYWREDKDEEVEIDITEEEKNEIIQILKHNIGTYYLPISYKLIPHGQYDVVLSVFDRVSLLSLLPDKGTYEELKNIKDIRTALGVNDDEYKLLGLHQRQDGKLVWNKDYDSRRLYRFNKAQFELLKRLLDKVSAEGRLSYGGMELYEKFHISQV